MFNDMVSEEFIKIDNTSIDKIDAALKKENFIDMLTDNEYKINIDFSNNLLTKESVDDIFDKSNALIDVLTRKADTIESNIKSINFSIDPTKEKVTSNVDIRDITTVSSNNIKNINNSYSLSTPSKSKKCPVPVSIKVKTNGFIGDTKRGKITSYGEYEFDGRLNPMASVFGLIDRSMCCFELIHLSATEYDKYKGTGFMYDENISFISSDEHLNVELEIDFTSDTCTNMLSFMDNFSAPFVINHIKIIDTNGNIYDVCQDLISSGLNILDIPYIKAKKAFISITQNIAIDSSIIKSRDNSRVGSISSLGMYIKDSKIVHQEFNSQERSLGNVNDLFIREYPKELINVSRYSVCIGELTFYDNEYDESGVFIKKIVTQNNIASVTIDAIEIMSQDHKIKYYISSDNSNYIEVSPISRAYNKDIHTIFFSNTSIISGANSKCIVTDNSINTIYIKISLESSSNRTTPIIKSLMLNIEEEE